MGVVLRVHELFVNPRNDGMPRPAAWRELFSAARLFLPGTRDMLWAWDDPWPAILELLAACKRLCREDAKSLIRHIIPKTTLARLRTWRSLDDGIRGIYMQRQLHRMVWPRKPRLPKQVGSVLSICHGNIIRSPFAAAQFASAGLRSVSAGLHARPGRAADERAMRIASEFGVSLARHEAALLTEAMIEEADVVFVMDRINEARLLFRYPRARKKLLLLGAFAAQRPDGDEIPDPYNEDEQAIRECYETISHCVAQIAGELGLGVAEVRQSDC